MNLPIRASAIELQHLEETISTAGWALIVRKIEAMGNQIGDAMRKSESWATFLETRGKLTGLGLALQAPDILKQEISERLRKEGK